MLAVHTSQCMESTLTRILWQLLWPVRSKNNVAVSVDLWLTTVYVAYLNSAVMDGDDVSQAIGIHHLSCLGKREQQQHTPSDRR